MVKLSFTSDFLETQLAQTLQNVRDSLGRGLPSLQELAPEHDGVFVIAGTGPSLEGSLDALRSTNGFLCAVNEAHDYLIDRGFMPDGWIYMEIEPLGRNILNREAPECKYFIASQCAPPVFEHAKGRDVVLWHAWQDRGEGEIISEYEPSPKLIGGGATPTLRAICLGIALGYRKFEMFGVDASYAVNSHVGYSSEREDWSGEAHLEIICAGRKFRTVGYLARQASDFKEFLERHDHKFDLKMHGDGLMQHIHRIRQLNKRLAVQ